MTLEQLADWKSTLLNARILQTMAGNDDPIIFHGTNQKSARAILVNGFDPETLFVQTRNTTNGSSPCVFWTNNIEIASNFSQMKSDVDTGFPVIFSARLSAVIKSGIPVPDLNAWSIDTDEDPLLEPADWRDSLEKFECLAVLECQHVENLRLHAPIPLDVMPDPIFVERQLYALCDGTLPIEYSPRAGA